MSSTRRNERESLPGERRGFVAVDGTDLAYCVAGDGPELVFVHAGITDSRLWDAQFEAFHSEYRVVVYDLRGFGRSVLPPGPYAHHEDLLRVLEALDVDRAHLVGASMGAATAVDFALEHPGRVRSLTLVGPAISGYDYDDPDTQSGWDAASDAFDAGDFDRTATIEAEMWLAGVGRSLDEIAPETTDFVRRMLRRSYELADERATVHELDPPAVGRLDELRLPVLVVYGDHERPDIVAVAHLLGDTLDDVTTELLVGTAHLPSLERPTEFDALLWAFLDSVAER